MQCSGQYAASDGTLEREGLLDDRIVYFDGHGSFRALIVLSVYAVLGAGVAMIAYRLRARGGAATGDS